VFLKALDSTGVFTDDVTTDDLRLYDNTISSIYVRILKAPFLVSQVNHPKLRIHFSPATCVI
jgi:hypothetical protein